MKKTLLVASVLALATGACAPTSSQTSMQMPMSGGMSGGTMTAADVGMQPMTSTSAADYAKMAADSDMYEIQSSQLALTNSRDAGVRSYAQQMITDHNRTTNALMAAVNNSNGRVPMPDKMMSAANMAKIAQLRQAPNDSFDRLYLQQQMMSHQMAWALHKGFATNGSDPALRQVAMTAVPIIENHLQHLKSMPMAGM